MIAPPGMLRQLKRTTSLPASWGGGELDPFAGGGVGEWRKGAGVGRPVVCAGHELGPSVAWRTPFRAAIPIDGCGDRAWERRAGAPEGGLVLGGVKDEGLLELVGHLGQLPHHRVEYARGRARQLGQGAHTHRMPDLDGHEVEHLAGGDGLRARQVPHGADRPLVGAEHGQTGGDVRDVAVGVGQIGVAEEVRALAGQRVGEHALAERRLGDPGAEEVRRPPDRDSYPAGIRGASSSWVIAARVRPLTVVAASGRSSVIGLPPVGP